MTTHTTDIARIQTSAEYIGLYLILHLSLKMLRFLIRQVDSFLLQVRNFPLRLRCEARRAKHGCLRLSACVGVVYSRSRVVHSSSPITERNRTTEARRHGEHKPEEEVRSNR